jgi:type I restriction enzyme S subunit
LDNQYEALRTLSSGDGIRGGLNLELLRNFVVKFPNSTTEQIKIGQTLTDMDKQIYEYNSEIEQWRIKRNIITQVLLTGIVRAGAPNEW